jgi:hypothetical protein
MSKFKTLLNTLNLRKQIREFTTTCVAKIEDATRISNPAERAERFLTLKGEIDESQKKIARNSLIYAVAGVTLNFCLLAAMFVLEPLTVIALGYAIFAPLATTLFYGLASSDSRRRKLTAKCDSEIDVIRQQNPDNLAKASFVQKNLSKWIYILD